MSLPKISQRRKTNRSEDSHFAGSIVRLRCFRCEQNAHTPDEGQAVFARGSELDQGTVDVYIFIFTHERRERREMVDWMVLFMFRWFA